MVAATSLKGQSVEALDGHIGHVEDVYFDTIGWKVRYLVIKTGEWLLGRKVLVSPEALADGWHGESGVRVNLAKDRIRSSPDIDTAQPLSVATGRLLHEHYAWLPYAVGTERAGSRLCRVADLLGYRLAGKNGLAGRVEDFVIHEEDAELRYVAVHVPKGLTTKTVLIHTSDVNGFDWENRVLLSGLSRHDIEASPEYEKAVR